MSAIFGQRVKRIKTVASWARVAVPLGDSVVVEVPTSNPFATAQDIAGCAYGLIRFASAKSDKSTPSGVKTPVQSA